MITTGYKLQAAIKRAKAAREIKNHVFNENLFQFDSEKEKNVNNEEVWTSFLKEENRLVKLQTLQQEYNQAVKVKVFDEEITLSEATKRVGVAARAERIWKQAAKGSVYKTRSSRRGWGEDTSKIREEGKEYARAVFEVDYCTEKAKVYGSVSGALREAVQTGNAVEVDLAGASEELFV